MNRRGSAWLIAIAFILIVLIVFAVVYRFSETATPQQTNPTEREYQEIHVESIQINETYQKLLTYMKKHPKTMLMLIVAYFKPANITPIIRQRYAQLAKMNYSLGLHVHIAIKPEINMVPYESQLKAIRYGKDFLANLNITTTHFAPGWWSFNTDTLQACYALGLTHFHVAWVHCAKCGAPLSPKPDTSNWPVEAVLVKWYAHDNEL